MHIICMHTGIVTTAVQDSPSTECQASVLDGVVRKQDQVKHWWHQNTEPYSTMSRSLKHCYPTVP